MVKAMKHVEGRSKDERIKVRKQLGSLKNLTVQPGTKRRYEKAREKFYSFLHQSNLSIPRKREALDGLLCDYLEFLWSTGEGRGLASDTVAGLQDHDPHLRGQLLASWRLLKAWSVHELPNRAPPFPESVLHAMVGWATFKNHHWFGLSLLVAYYGLLRTGELYALTSQHVAMDSKSSIALVNLD